MSAIAIRLQIIQDCESFQKAVTEPQQAGTSRSCLRLSHYIALQLQDGSFRAVARSSKHCGKDYGLPGIGLNVRLHNCVGHCGRGVLNLTVARSLRIESRDGSTKWIYPGASVVVNRCSWSLSGEIQYLRRGFGGAFLPGALSVTFALRVCLPLDGSSQFQLDSPVNKFRNKSNSLALVFCMRVGITTNCLEGGWRLSARTEAH